MQLIILKDVYSKNLEVLRQINLPNQREKIYPKQEKK
jgi:hypothetical protein